MLLLLLDGADVLAGDAVDVRVTHEHGTYRIRAALLVDAPADAVLRQLTDYANLTALNPSIRKSILLPAPPPHDARVATVVEACVQVLCRTLTRVEDVTKGPRRLVAVIVPALSDFRRGRAEWSIRPRGQWTDVRYSAELEPDFVVPPVLGPALIKGAMEREIRTLLRNLERRAADA